MKKMLFFILLIALVIGIFSTKSAGLDSEQDDPKEKIQELERKLNEEETAHNLIKARYQVLEERFNQLLFDSPQEMELKTYFVRLLEEKFRVRLFDEGIPWDTHEAYIILQIFQNFPKEVQEYFLQGANPVLTIKIENPDRMITKEGTTGHGMYNPCLHTILLNRNVLRGSWFNFPSEIWIRGVIAHELGHAYDRSRALAELKGTFRCTLPGPTYYSVGNEEYRHLIRSGGNVRQGVALDTQEEMIIENFGEVFGQFIIYRERQKLPSKEARYQYDFFYQNVFCGEYLRVLKEYELRNETLDLTGSRHFCS